MEKDVRYTEKLHTRILVKEMPCGPTAEQAEKILALLPAWRRRQAEQYRMAADRMQSAAAYLLLEELAAGCAERRRADGVSAENTERVPSAATVTPALPEFSYGEDGKPCVAQMPGLHFNMSHCRRAVMSAVADGSGEFENAVGCDIEEIPGSIDADLMALCFSEDEQREINGAECPEAEFAAMWTRKEAFVKMLGTGLADDLPGLMHTPEAEGAVFHTEVCRGRGYAYTVCRRARTAESNA